MQAFFRELYAFNNHTSSSVTTFVTLSYIIPEFWGEFLDIKKNFRKSREFIFRKKIDQFENFKAIWTFTWHVGNISQAKTLTKRFWFVFQPTKRGVSPFVSYIHQCLEHWAPRFFIRVIYTTTYQRLFTKRGRTTHCFLLYRYKKKPKFLRIFGNFREFLENFRHF